MVVHRSLWVKLQCEAEDMRRDDIEWCTDLLAALWLEHLDPAGSCDHITQTTGPWSSCNMGVLFALQIYVQAMTSGTCECDTFRELRLCRCAWITLQGEEFLKRTGIHHIDGKACPLSRGWAVWQLLFFPFILHNWKRMDFLLWSFQGVLSVMLTWLEQTQTNRVLRKGRQLRID